MIGCGSSMSRKRLMGRLGERGKARSFGTGREEKDPRKRKLHLAHAFRFRFGFI